MHRSRFDGFNSFLRKRRKMIIAVWIIAVIVAGSQIPAFFSSVSYNITGGNFGGPSNTESQVAQSILNTEFPSSNGTGNNAILLVIQDSQMYSPSVQAAVLGLNRTVAADHLLSGAFAGMDGLYSTEYSSLESVLPSLVAQVSLLSSSILSLDTGAHQLFESNYELEQGLIGINQTAQLVYGIPSAFVLAWSGALGECGGSASCANGAANKAVIPEVTQNALSLAYYSAFYNVWNASFTTQPNLSSPSPTVREQSAVNQAVSEVSGNPELGAQESQTLSLVASGLTTADWFQTDAVGNLTVTALQGEVPANVSSSLGVSLSGLVSGLISLGPSPDNATLQQFTLVLFASSPSVASQTGRSGPSDISLIDEAYALGPAPTHTQTWNLASTIVANATVSSFATSPLFTANGRQLDSLLYSFADGASAAQITAGILNVVSNETYSDYPLTLGRSITQNFVSADNTTMMVVYNFSVLPSSKMIAAFRTDVANSGVPSLGTYYVTGGAVLTQDISDKFGPVVGITVVPGVLASLAIVGVLLLAPLAAVVPVMVGGIAIAIALPSVYYGIHVLTHGTLTFLTPALTILLTLGLAVDYSVLQLRRTKEERENGRNTEESVSVSVRWAGQAVLTAGVTVVVAYIVMAVANVPLFSGVGTSIAIAVSILVLAALTLLPALELTLKDKLFWPGLNRRRTVQKSKVSRMTRLGETTLRRKLAIAVVVTAIAAGAFYVIHVTPDGEDILRLFPNFQSNEGLTVLTNELGSAVISPSVIVVTTPTPILYGNDQFNQTLMAQIEQISSTVSAVPGVASVRGPTMPYGSAFNYSSVIQMPEPERSQYLAGMLSDIGINNKTAQIQVGLEASGMSEAAINTLLKVESSIASHPPMEGIAVYYAGETQAAYDSQSFLNGIIPEVIVVLGAAVYVILLLQLRSAFTPVRLVFTILCSIAFASALLIAVYYWAQGLPILDFAPLFVVVTMLGVGIDYDIFFVTRIREEVLNGNSDDDAIKKALDKVWVTIFGLGLVLATVFTSLIATRIALLGEIGFVVAAAVLVDVGVVILFFVPALMSLAQRFNWWPAKIGGREKIATQEGQENAPGGD